MQAPPDARVPLPATPELDAAILQAAITAALGGLCLLLYRRYRKPYFAWWAAAWGLYVLRVGAIVSFLLTSRWIWLYWHQVFTGWTALALLWTSLVFSQGVRWRPAYLAAVLIPPIWSYVAIYHLDVFLLAAGPAVLFLSLATLATSWAFFRYHRRVRSAGAALLAGALLLWALHHLDYPFLRARGAWVPWGYYLDILFELALGAGIVLLVLDDLHRGLGALSTLSGDLQASGRERDVMDVLLRRPLTLPGVRGSALYLAESGIFAGGAGACAEWEGTAPSGAGRKAIAAAVAEGRPRPLPGPLPFGAVLPIFRGAEAIGALALVGDARDPFTALDEDFLLALGRQVGAALENADLYRRLQARTVELARLSARMVEQHEEERRRLSRELHDETAQVFTAVKMELGVLRESLGPREAERLDGALQLVDTGIRSIRNVTNDLRPSLLDDLGLVPALRSLAAEFTARSGIAIDLAAPAALPALSKDAELALFRALQEALSNVLRHAGAQAVAVDLAVIVDGLKLTVQDDGLGPPDGTDPARFERDGHMGLAGMRERIAALGGTVRFGRAGGRGARLEVEVPVA